MQEERQLRWTRKADWNFGRPCYTLSKLLNVTYMDASTHSPFGCSSTRLAAKDSARS